MGRPKKVIDYETVEKLANIQCTQEEIANFLGISVRTLKRDDEFCRLYKKGMDNGKMSLRRWQFEKAKKGNTSMLIWLGRQYLGQSEETKSREKMQEAQTKRINAETNKIESNMASGFDASAINDLNKSVLENVAPTRDLEDFE